MLKILFMSEVLTIEVYCQIFQFTYSNTINAHYILSGSKIYFCIIHCRDVPSSNKSTDLRQIFFCEESNATELFKFLEV